MRDMAHRTRDFMLRFRRVLTIALQLALIAVSNRIAFSLRFDNSVPEWALIAFWQMLPWLVAIRAFTFIPFRMYEGLWRYTSIYDLQALIGSAAVSSLVFYAAAWSPLGPPVYPRSIFIIDAGLLVLVLGGVRLARRLYAEFTQSQAGKRVLIVGAGDAGELIVRDMKNNRQHSYCPIGFIDDDPAKLGSRIHGVPVLGTRKDVRRILTDHRPDEVLIATPHAEPAAVRSLVRVFEPFNIPIKTLPNMRDIIDGKVEVGQIRSLSIEDLLSRAPVGLDRAPLKQLIAGRRVMVTGAGGSIGSELCRQIARLKPARLLMFERYENTLHEIRMELEDQKLSVGLVAIVGDVTDAARVDKILLEHRPEIIFHAAAHKHVPLMEENPCEAIKNNVRGTRLLAKAAEVNGVDRFIMISTDKAVNPTSMMGASKRLAELVIQAQADGSGTAFSIVRFGNVLGSNGSVVPRFLAQIRKGGPITVTHPEMRRFFMLIPEAVQLVLHAASQADRGATYVLEMGEPVKLVDMARDLIRLTAPAREAEIDIEFVGLRPGEKLFEELVGPDEQAGPSRVPQIMCVRSRRRPASDLSEKVQLLEAAAARGQTDIVRTSMIDLVRLGVGALEPEPASADPEVVKHVARVIASETRQPCPKCAAGPLLRSRTRSAPEKVRRQLSVRRPFRCDSCGWRGWLEPKPVGDCVMAPPSALPDLSVIDYAIAPQAAAARRPSFAPRNLS